MNSPEKVFKLQTQLSECSGKQRIFEWLIVIGLLVLLWASVDALLAKESLLRAASSPLFLVALFIHMRADAKRKVAKLIEQLSS